MVVRVRDITNSEGNKLRNIVRHGKDPIEMKRAQVVLSSAQGFEPGRIADIVLMTPDYVRDLIHLFNEEGFIRDAKAPLEARRKLEIQRRAEAEACFTRHKQTFRSWSSIPRVESSAIERRG
jgi:hypothetical protein